MSALSKTKQRCRLAKCNRDMTTIIEPTGREATRSGFGRRPITGAFATAEARFATRLTPALQARLIQAMAFETLHAADESELRGSRWRFALLVWLCWTVPGLITTTLGLTVARNPTEVVPVLPILISQLAAWWFWAAATPIVWWLGRTVPLERRTLASRLPAHAVFALLAGLMYAFANTVIMRIVFPESASEGAFWPFMRNYIPSRVPVGVLLYFALLGIGALIVSQRRLRERDLQASKLSAELARAQVQALQTQLQPHFLFNTLHAIGMLVHEDPASASRMLTRLGDLLRQTLALTDVPEITLREELSILDDYIGIERVRFGDRLTVAVSVDNSLLEFMVPTFVLQPLVENAIRYGVTSRVGPGTIRISAKRSGSDLQLIVQDDGPEASVVQHLNDVTRRRLEQHDADRPSTGNGIGLSSTRARLAALYSESERAAISLEKHSNGGTSAVLTLPMRHADV